MAISKQQPMRPAEIELVDAVDGISDNLNDEISQREEADRTLHNEINAEIQNRIDGDNALQQSIIQEATLRNENDVELQKNIDAEQVARQLAVEAIQQQLDKFEAGQQNDIQVIANNNTQITVTFDNPKTEKPIVIITLESTEDETNKINCYAALTDVSETEFHVRIYNLDEENEHTLVVNWLAIGE